MNSIYLTIFAALILIIPVLYYLLIYVLSLFSLGHGINVRVKGPNYTDGQTKEIIARYKSGETLEDNVTGIFVI